LSEKNKNYENVYNIVTFYGIMISILDPNPDSQGSAPDFGRLKLELDPHPN
jgi:hypothetical protein